MPPRAPRGSLVQRGWLTIYQMNQLLADHGSELTLGPYHILDRIGQGGQSLVYKARHLEHSWEVALKVIRTELAANPAAGEQFLQEMEAMARLDHPNIVQFCDADLACDTFYCAMEFIEGTDLAKHVSLMGVLTPVQAAEYVRQTALGLQHAYENNLIHRDIKPQNLFLTATTPACPSLVKILDWGLACLRPPGGVRENDQPDQGRHRHRRLSLSRTGEKRQLRGHPRRHLQSGLYAVFFADRATAVSGRHAHAKVVAAPTGDSTAH